MPSQHLEFILKESPEETVLEIRGTVSGDAVEELSTEMERALSAADDKSLTVNLEGVDAINSAGLGKLLLHKKRANRLGKGFKIRGCSDSLYSALVAVRLDSVIDIER